MRKIVYELRKAFPFAEIETARGGPIDFACPAADGVHVGYAVRSTCDAQHQGPSSKGAQDAATSLIPIEGSAPC